MTHLLKARSLQLKLFFLRNISILESKFSGLGSQIKYNLDLCEYCISLLIFLQKIRWQELK